MIDETMQMPAEEGIMPDALVIIEVNDEGPFMSPEKFKELCLALDEIEEKEKKQRKKRKYKW